MSILDNEAGSRACASKNSAKLVIRVSSGIDGRVHQEGERVGSKNLFRFVHSKLSKGRKYGGKLYSSYLLLSSGERPRN